jgi:hypothetical protein
MTAALLDAASVCLCPHGGRIMLAAAPRITLAGLPAAVFHHGSLPIAGCPAADPCVIAAWLGGTRRVTASGQSLLAAGSAATCTTASGLASGPAIVGPAQGRVSAD